jgi:hypothetical protein
MGSAAEFRVWWNRPPWPVVSRVASQASWPRWTPWPWWTLWPAAVAGTVTSSYGGHAYCWHYRARLVNAGRGNATAARLVWFPGWRDAPRPARMASMAQMGGSQTTAGVAARLGSSGIRAAGHATKWIRFLGGSVQIFRHLQPCGEKYHRKGF